MTHGEPDPEVVAAVAHIRDSFGAQGLRDLVRLAEEELLPAERALAELEQLDELEDEGRVPAGEPDTDAWQAYREADPPELGDGIVSR